jgi:putative hydrolase of the HAD superfamily
MQPHALFIDAYGTLVHLADPAARLVAVTGDRFGVQITKPQAAAALAAEIAHYRAHMDEACDARRVAFLRAGCAEVLRDALPPLSALRAADRETMTEVLLASLRFEAYPDVRDALVRARRAGAWVIVVSNWDVSLADVLEQLGLAPLLDGVITSAAVGARKPDPAIFAAALALAGAHPDRCRHVGDSLTEDVAGARAAGIEPVLLDRLRAAPATGEVSVIGSLAELDVRR